MGNACKSARFAPQGDGSKFAQPFLIQWTFPVEETPRITIFRGVYGISLIWMYFRLFIKMSRDFMVDGLYGVHKAIVDYFLFAADYIPRNFCI